MPKSIERYEDHHVVDDSLSDENLDIIFHAFIYLFNLFIDLFIYSNSIFNQIPIWIDSQHCEFCYVTISYTSTRSPSYYYSYSTNYILKYIIISR